MPADTKTVPLALLHEADGLLSLVAHRYRVHEIPRDLCEELIACSHKLRNLATAPTLPEPRPDDEGREKPACPDVIRRAADELARLCAGRGRMSLGGLVGRGWTMCIPRRPDDSDEVFSDLIEAAAKWHVASLTPHPAPIGATDEGRDNATSDLAWLNENPQLVGWAPGFLGSPAAWVYRDGIAVRCANSLGDAIEKARTALQAGG